MGQSGGGSDQCRVWVFARWWRRTLETKQQRLTYIFLLTHYVTRFIPRYPKRKERRPSWDLRKTVCKTRENVIREEGQQVRREQTARRDS